MTRKTGHEVLKAAFEKAGLNGKLATHSLRKSYAQRMYDASGDIFLVREMLGHADVRTTQKYLGVSYQKAQRVSEAIETSKGNISGILLRSVSELETDTLVMELQRRGFDATAIMGKFRDTCRKSLQGVKFNRHTGLEGSFFQTSADFIGQAEN